MAALNLRLSRETGFMLRTPEEVSESLAEQVGILGRIRESRDEHLLVAVVGGEIVGFAAAHRRPFSRVRHVFSLVLGVARSNWGRGIGHALLHDIETWASRNQARRLELTVLSNNDRAICLYRRCGYAIEGTRRSAIRAGDEFLDELYMSRLVTKPAAAIRQASAADALAIARVHVDSWQQAYRGIVPQSHLDQLSVATREKMWVEIFQQGNSETLVAYTEERVVGFISLGHLRDDQAARDAGEIYAIYVCPAHWCTGVGASLWWAALACLRERGFVRVAVWVLAANARAIRFYESVGLALSADSATSLEIGGISLPELRYESSLI